MRAAAVMVEPLIRSPAGKLARLLVSCPLGLTPLGARELLRSAGLLQAPGLGLYLEANVAHRLDRAHARDHVEVVDRRWRGREPLERVCLPRVGARDLAGLVA